MKVPLSTAAWSALLLLLVGAYGGIEVATWGVDKMRAAEREEWRREAMTRRPPIVPQVSNESCVEVVTACYARKRQARVKAKTQL